MGNTAVGIGGALSGNVGGDWLGHSNVIVHDHFLCDTEIGLCDTEIGDKRGVEAAYRESQIMVPFKCRGSQ